MTAFELYLQKERAVLIDGSLGEFNTYTNCYRNWRTLTGYKIQIGLFRVGEHNVIGIRQPFVDYLPTDNFENYLNKIIDFHENGWIGGGLAVENRIKNFKGILVNQS